MGHSQPKLTNEQMGSREIKKKKDKMNRIYYKSEVSEIVPKIFPPSH